MRSDRPTASLDRRSFLAGTAGTLGLAAAGSATESAVQPTKKKINQSLAHWCYKPYWKVSELIGVAKQLGCKSIELIPPEHWPELKENGLVCAISSSHSFRTGLNNPKYWDMCFEKLKARVDDCVKFGFKNVITFTGYAEGISKQQGLKNCVAALNKIVPYAAEKNVTLCLEMLNTRDSSHPMKGHPGYQGDNTEYCIEIIKQVGSAHLKLLFDIYHVQIMDGDVIRRIHQFSDYIGHVHTAGNPGRGELDDQQEINYPAVMQALLDVGYTGFVGQEFIPTRDALTGLKQAVSRCDV